MQFQTVAQLFEFAVTQHNIPNALVYEGRDGNMYQISTNELKDRVVHLALGLKKLGVRPEKRVILFTGNRPKWLIVDCACHLLGAVVVAIDPASDADEAEWIIQDSGSEFAAISHETSPMLLTRPGTFKRLKYLVAMDERALGSDAILFEKVLEEGREDDSLSLPELVSRASNPNGLATISYPLKGGRLQRGIGFSQRNLVAGVSTWMRSLPLDSRDKGLAVLSLAQVCSRTFSYRCLVDGISLGFSDASHTEGLIRKMKPTIITGSAEFFEKLGTDMADEVGKATGIGKLLSTLALNLGRKKATGHLIGTPVSRGVKILYRLLTRAALSRIKRGLGRQIKFLVSSGPALAPEKSHLFYTLGLRLLEGFCISEAAAFVALNPHRRPKLASAGKAVPGTSIKISEAGNIVVSGATICDRYFRDTDFVNEQFVDGWLNTEKFGRFDDDGYLIVEE